MSYVMYCKKLERYKGKLIKMFAHKWMLHLTLIPSILSCVLYWTFYSVFEVEFSFV